MVPARRAGSSGAHWGGRVARAVRGGLPAPDPRGTGDQRRHLRADRPAQRRHRSGATVTTSCGGPEAARPSSRTWSCSVPATTPRSTPRSGPSPCATASPGSPHPPGSTPPGHRSATANTSEPARRDRPGNSYVSATTHQTPASGEREGASRVRCRQAAAGRDPATYVWGQQRDSNPQPSAYKAGALPVAPCWQREQHQRRALRRALRPVVR